MITKRTEGEVRWLVTGAGGALGSDLVAVLDTEPDADLTAFTRAQLDVTDPVAVGDAVAQWAAGQWAAGRPPGVVVNAAAFTAVDRAETDPAAAEEAAVANGEAPGYLATACARVGARLIHVSTDYVFDGAATRPYEPGDPTGPLGVYGRTKLAGEQRVRAALPDAHHVVRTAWVYGGTGSNFVRTVARRWAETGELDVVADQHGAPTWSRDLAAGLVELGRRPVGAGTLHATGGGATTWHGFARAVVAEMGGDPDGVRPCSTDRFPRPARRPAYSVLSDAGWRAAGLSPLPAWRRALSEAVRRHPDLIEWCAP